MFLSKLLFYQRTNPSVAFLEGLHTVITKVQCLALQVSRMAQSGVFIKLYLQKHFF